MKRKRTVKITVTHRRRISLDQIVIRLQCPVCGHEIKSPGLNQVETVLGADDIVGDSSLPRTAFGVPALAGNGSFTNQTDNG